MTVVAASVQPDSPIVSGLVVASSWTRRGNAFSSTIVEQVISTRCGLCIWHPGRKVYRPLSNAIVYYFCSHFNKMYLGSLGIEIRPHPTFTTIPDVQYFETELINTKATIIMVQIHRSMQRWAYLNSILRPSGDVATVSFLLPLFPRLTGWINRFVRQRFVWPCN